MWECDDPRWPPIPAQDFSNLPAPAAGPARAGLRVHAPVRAGSRATSRTSSARSTASSPACPYEQLLPGAARGQRVPASSSRSSTSASERSEHDDRRFADVAEGVRATIAAYTQALDDGRTDDVVATFCPDGVVRDPGHGHPRGPRRAARGLRRSGRRGGRSATSSLNTLVTDWNDDEATAISDVVFLLQGDAGWAVQLVGRYHDTLHHDDGTWRFHRRAAEFVT